MTKPVAQIESLIEKNKLPEAEKLLSKSENKLKPWEKHYCTGLILNKKEDRDASFAAFENALKENEQYHPAFAAVAELYYKNGHMKYALDCYMQALSLSPENPEYLYGISRVLTFFVFTEDSPAIKNVLLQCFKHPQIQKFNLGKCWLGLVISDPKTKPLMEAGINGKKKKFEKLFLKQLKTGKINDEFFLEGLNKTVVMDINFENFFVLLRSTLMKNIDNIDIPDKNFLQLAEAIANYGYNTEFIIPVPEEDSALICQIKDKQITEKRLNTILACYGTKLLRQHKEERDLIRKYEQQITAITEIEDMTSSSVREQYEESPFPRWQGILKKIKIGFDESFLSEKNSNILVAGCGTGNEAATIAHKFPESFITAIDLSRNSLAYGKMKTEALGIKNIQFHQADIIGLSENSEMKEKFDFITCSGVLHHMKDPAQGWAILTKLLKPKGLMHIALYSQKGRKSIISTQNTIKKNGYKTTLEDIRRFRKDARKLLSPKDFNKLSEYHDYFFLSEFRDMLFHVQEHCLTIPQIENLINKLGLSFLKFHVNEQSIEKYRKLFPDDKNENNLKNWDRFEKDNPDTFKEMYQFMCRKKNNHSCFN